MFIFCTWLIRLLVSALQWAICDWTFYKLKDKITKVVFNYIAYCSSAKCFWKFDFKKLNFIKKLSNSIEFIQKKIKNRQKLMHGQHLQTRTTMIVFTSLVFTVDQVINWYNLGHYNMVVIELGFPFCCSLSSYLFHPRIYFTFVCVCLCVCRLKWPTGELLEFFCWCPDDCRVLELL